MIQYSPIKKSLKIKHCLIPVWILIVISSSLSALTKPEIRDLVHGYIRLHYSAHSLNDELSERTLKKYIEALDPGKMYFLEADIERFEKRYSKVIDNQLRRGNTQACKTIYDTYLERFHYWNKRATDLIDEEHDFTLDEYLDVDRRKRKYLDTSESLDELWRKWIKFQLKKLYESTYDWSEARKNLHKRYELIIKHISERTEEEWQAIVLNAYTKALDPHSAFFRKDNLEDFHISTSLSLYGIGARIRTEYGIPKIQSLIPGGPADRAGELQPDDKVLAVAEAKGEFESVVDLPLRQVVRHIRGDQGTVVRLKISRDTEEGSEERVLSIIRDKIELKEAAARYQLYQILLKGDTGDDLSQKGTAHEKKTRPEVLAEGHSASSIPGSSGELLIGVIRLPSFYRDFKKSKTGKHQIAMGESGREGEHSSNSSSLLSSEGKANEMTSATADIKNLINEIRENRKLDGLIIDIRGNSGGSMDEAIKLAGLFIDAGPMLQVRGSNGRRTIFRDDDGSIFYDGPLAIMVNRYSASSSEILAGAIKDHKRGILVGDSHTFGKGTVQKVIELKKGKMGAIKVTTSQFFRPSGKSTQLWGVKSDIVLPSVFNAMEIGEETRDFALPWKRVPSVMENPSTGPTMPLEVLEALSRQRINTNESFSKTYSSIEKYHLNKEKRSRVSLQLKGKEDKQADREDILPETTDENTKSVTLIGEKEAKSEADNGMAMESLNPYIRETISILADYVLLQNDIGPAQIEDIIKIENEE